MAGTQRKAQTFTLDSELKFEIVRLFKTPKISLSHKVHVKILTGIILYACVIHVHKVSIGTILL